MKIALDLDGVLADLHAAMVADTSYTRSDFEQWDKPNYDRFMRDAARVWNDTWDVIDPVEPHIGSKTEALNSEHTVDIVTNTAGSDESVRQWLDKHNVSYESIVHPRAHGYDKPDLDTEYDCFIDDKPDMAGSVSMLYLRDQRWNQRVRGSGEYLYHSYESSYVDSEGYPDGHFDSDAPCVVRVTSLADVLFDIKTYNA